MNIAATAIYAAGITASCGENGSKTYFADITVDGEYMTDYITVEIPKTGNHTYTEPTWSWAEDDSAADAVFTCSVCGEKHTEHASITTKTLKEATYTEKGQRKHTATVTFAEQTYTDTVMEEFSGDFAARIGETGYKTFEEAAAAAKGKNIVLLRNMDSAFDIQNHNADVLRVQADGFTADVQNYKTMCVKKTRKTLPIIIRKTRLPMLTATPPRLPPAPLSLPPVPLTLSFGTAQPLKPPRQAS